MTALAAVVAAVVAATNDNNDNIDDEDDDDNDGDDDGDGNGGDDDNIEDGAGFTLKSPKASSCRGKGTIDQRAHGSRVALHKG